MLTLSYLYNVVVGATIGAADHNTLVQGEQEILNTLNRYAYVFDAIGHLPAMVGVDMDQRPAFVPLTITDIRVICQQTAASGSVTVDLLKCTPGGTPVSLYTTNPLPVLTYNGGYAYVVSQNLPNTVAVAAGEILIARIQSASNGAYDLKVMVS